MISITDGQIYLESNLFNAGIRPAVNVGISVSRVGGDAQSKAMKQVAGRLRLDMAAYRELAAFALMSSDLDKTTQQQLGRGQRMQEILKQPQYSPMSLADQVIVIFAGTNGFADQVPVEKMVAWQAELLKYMELSYPEIGREIAEKKIITDDNRDRLKQALQTFRIPGGRRPWHLPARCGCASRVSRTSRRSRGRWRPSARPRCANPCRPWLPPAPYATKAWQVLTHVAAQPGRQSLHPLLTERPEPKVGAGHRDHE